MTDDPHSHGPLDGKAIDRDIRINELKEQLNELGGDSTFHVSDDCEPDVLEEFVKHIAQYEAAELTSHFEGLVKAGTELTPPESLDDASLTLKLWEVINALAAMNVFLSRTDHLSDRQLYEHLWDDSLREGTKLMPPECEGTYHIDLIGSCSEEDIQISLRYYDTEEDRRRWATSFPDDVIPPREKAPFDRDRHLPRTEYD